MKARIIIGAALAFAVWGGPLTAQTHAESHTHPAGDVAVAVRNDLGSYARPITTGSATAQALFNQGLRYQYAFNHEQAIHSYQAALDADPGCAMCYWGIALAAGPNINAGVTEEGERVAFAAIREAMDRSGAASPVERELIRALGTRYGATPAQDRAARDTAFAEAMTELAARYPSDTDILTLHGAALMNLNPWNYWEGDFADRKPRPGTHDILSALESALEIDPDHPGACHYYIHAVEAGRPADAVACAERLAALMPGAGHLVHMPGHIYIRVGRYRDAVETNEHAVHSEAEFVSDQGAGTLYAGTYYPHNYHFMGFAATMAGMSAKALEAAREVAPRVPTEIARDFYWIQNAVVLPTLTLVNFGRWDEVLEASGPPAELGHATTMHRYARGVALAGLGRFAEARAILGTLEREAAALSGVDPAMDPVPFIAVEALAGEIALRSGDTTAAVARFRDAADIESMLLYDEPPLWFYPVRHSLGKALLAAGRPAEAEVAYRQDLDRFPDNGWSLFGLARSLEAQGRLDAARAVEERFRRAWADADVALEASRF